MLFSSFSELEPISCMNVNPHLYKDYSYSPSGDFLPNHLASPMKLLTDMNLDNSTSSSDTGLNEPRSKQKQSKKTSSNYNSALFGSSQGSLVKSIDETNYRGPAYLNPPDHKELSMPKKKLKTEQTSDFDSFHNEFKKSSLAPWNFFDNIDDNLIEKYSSDRWLQPDDSEEKLNLWGLPKGSDEENKENTQTTQPQEIMREDSLIKSEEVQNKTFFLEIDFAAGLPPPSTPDYVDKDGVCVLDGHEPQDTRGNNSESESPIQQVEFSENLSRNLQNLKNCLSSVTEVDFQRLDPEVYLNDNLINFYLKFIENGLLSEERRKKCHFFNTYFMAQMRKLFAAVDEDFNRFDSVYEKMGKWTKKTNIFEKDFLFIPVNDNEHWNLLVLCNPSHLFSNDDKFPFVMFLDSLSRMDNIYARMLFHYFARELKAKLPQQYMTFQSKVVGFNYTSLPYFQQMVPKQSNLTDCGLYLLQYIELFAEDDTPILATKEDINKRKWFPRRLIQEKRNQIKRIIEQLKNEQFCVIEEYRRERNKIITDCAKQNDEFDTFSRKDFQQAVTLTFGDRITSEQDKICLMLDYYYLGTLEYTQMAATSY